MSSTPGPMAAAGLTHHEHHISSSHSNGSSGTRHKSRSSRRSKLPSGTSMDQHDHKHRAPNISKQSSSYHQSRSDERDYPPIPPSGGQGGSSSSMSRTSSRSNVGSRGESLTRHNSGGSIRGSSGSQLGRSNSGNNYANHSGSTKQRTGSNGSSTPPSRAGMGSPTSISSRSERLKRRTASGSGGGDESPQRNLSPAGSKAHFDMKHMHRSIEAVVEEVRDSSAPSGLRSPIEKQPLMQQVIASAPEPTTAFSPNGLPTALGATRANSSDPKKERYRSLWGKVGKQAPVLQPKAAGDVGESGPNTPTGSGPNPKKKWDMVLNPLVQRQKEKSGKKLSRKSSQLDATANYLLHQAEQQKQQQQHHQQQQHYMQQAMAQQINSMNAPNQSTTQCDCGDDSCPFCNLMLNMEMTDPNMLM